MSQRLSNEIIIDGKLMNIGKSSAWRDQVFQINHGVDVGPGDPGNEESSPRRVTGGSGGTALDQPPAPPRISSRRPSATELSLNIREENEILSLEPDQTELGLPLSVWSKVKRVVRVLAIVLFVAAYNAYIAYALHHHLRTGRVIDWCGGLGFLIIVTVIVYISLFYFHIIKKIIPWRKVGLLVPTRLIRIASTRQGRWLITIIVLAAFATF